MELTETVIGSQQIFDGKIVHLTVETVRLPNGHETKREIVHHGGAVCVVAVRADGAILMVRQFRLAAGKALLEIPAGTLEAGEDPADCAARELEEETGLKPGKLRFLFSAYLAPGYSTELIHAFLAEDLSQGTIHFDAGENCETIAFPPDELERMILAGEIQDSKSISALLVALRLISG
jgi:ADP-ribose pyrophosphatase